MFFYYQFSFLSPLIDYEESKYHNFLGKESLIQHFLPPPPSRISKKIDEFKPTDASYSEKPDENHESENKGSYLDLKTWCLLNPSLGQIAEERA